MSATTVKQAAPVTLDEFYAETMKANGVAIPTDVDIEKLAAARNVTPAVAKTAQAIYNQMLIDGVEHATAQDKLADALAVAQNFIAHNRKVAAFGASLAAELKTACAAAAQAVLTKHEIELSTYDAVKMGELALAHADITPEGMQAAQSAIIAAASTADGEEMSKRASAAVSLPEYDPAALYAGDFKAASLHLPTFYAATGAYYGGDETLGRAVASALSGSEKTADHRAAAHAFIAIASEARTWPESMKLASAEAPGISPAVEWYLNARRSDELQLRANQEA